MATTVIVLGAFTLVFSIANAILIVFLIQLQLLKRRARSIVTWIWKHAGYTSIDMMHRIYREGGMKGGTEDIIEIIEDAVEDEGDWSNDKSMLTDSELLNKQNMTIIEERRGQKSNEVSMKKRAERLLDQKMILDKALRQCTLNSLGEMECN